MDRLIYTALSGMRGSMARQTATANNLANANTVGFRAEMQSARSLWVQGEGSRRARPCPRRSPAPTCRPARSTIPAAISTSR